MERGSVRAKRAARSGTALVAGALALVLGLASCRSPRRQQPAFVAEITAQSRRIEELFRAGDLLGVADLYADDAQILDAEGHRTSGRAEIDQYWSAIEEPVDLHLGIKRIHGSAAVAYEIGTSAMITRRAGAPVTAVTDFLVIWRRDEKGEWCIAVDTQWPRDE